MLALALSAGSGLAQTSAPDAVPFRPGYAPAVVVDVRVNEAGPFPFLLDTGSSHSVISAELAGRLGMPRVAKTRVSTSAGDDWAPVVRVARLRVGPIDATDVLATELPDGRLAERTPFGGVLGLDVLGRRAFTLDYRRQLVEWPNESLQDNRGIPLDTSGSVWRIPAQSGSDRVWLVPDSGAGALVLFDRGQWTSVAYRSGTNRIETVTSVRNGRNGILAEMNLGLLGLVHQSVVVVDGADIDRAHGDGLLPLHFFDRVTFRPRERVLQLNLDAHRQPDPTR